MIYQLTLHTEDAAAGVAELESLGAYGICSIEEDDGATIIGYTDNLPERSPHIRVSPAAIDWEEQWALHAPGFKDGLVHLPCGLHTMRLKPGPGFGDCSHPTTRLMLRMMDTDLSGKSVLDVGTGSGVLAIAAALLGASSVVGIDIDEEALIHARANALLNDVGTLCSFGTQPLLEPDLLLINMIAAEQEIAWRQLNALGVRPSAVICSGVLAEQREAFLDGMPFTLQESFQEEEWCGFMLQYRL